jgi:hypothetical protein
VQQVEDVKSTTRRGRVLLGEQDVDVRRTAEGGRAEGEEMKPSVMAVRELVSPKPGGALRYRYGPRDALG